MKTVREYLEEAEICLRLGKTLSPEGYAKLAKAAEANIAMAYAVAELG